MTRRGNSVSDASPSLTVCLRSFAAQTYNDFVWCVEPALLAGSTHHTKSGERRRRDAPVPHSIRILVLQQLPQDRRQDAPVFIVCHVNRAIQPRNSLERES